MRICYCISHFHPVASGAERQAHLQAVELARRGHQVQVITRAVDGCSEREKIGGVSILRVIRPREFGPLFGVTFVTTLRAALRRLAESFDLVHCHQGLWEAVAAGSVLHKIGRPSVVQPAAGGEFGELHILKRTRGRNILRRLILKNSHFVAISTQIEQELIDFGVDRSRLSRLASGVDTETFSPGVSAVEAHLPPRPRAIFLGRLHAQKNLRTLISAWPAVRKRVPASLILAGDGPDRKELSELAQRLNIADSVTFVGAVSNPVDYLRAADVFVLPSVAEGMSNSLLEAMSVGLPVVVSNIGGNADLITDGQNGRLVEQSNVAAWSEAISQSIESAAKSSEQGRAARELVMNQFSIRVIVDRYIDLYERLLGTEAS